MKKQKKPTLKSISLLYKKRGIKNPEKSAKSYIKGYNFSKKNEIR